MNTERGGLEGTLSEARAGSTVLGGAEPESGGSDVSLPLWQRLERGGVGRAETSKCG